MTTLSMDNLEYYTVHAHLLTVDGKEFQDFRLTKANAKHFAIAKYLQYCEDQNWEVLSYSVNETLYNFAEEE